MHTELFDKIPFSGDFEEIHFGKTNEVTWVKFEEDDGTSWCGKFDLGMTSFSKVLQEDTDFPIVISNGLIHKVDRKNKKILYQLDNDCIHGALFDTDTQYLVTHDGSNIHIIDKDGDCLRDERIAIDGIEFHTIQNGIISGNVDDIDGNKKDFTYNILTKRLRQKKLIDRFLEYFSFLFPPL